MKTALALIAVAVMLISGITATNNQTAWSNNATENHYQSEADGVIINVQGIQVDASIAPALNELINHARRDGIHLGGWGWRSHQRQHELRRINGCPDGWTHHQDERLDWWSPSGRCRIPTARPGSSLHETGLAIDFTAQGFTINSRSSAAFRWLARHASIYGLYNLPSEPWHWSTTGR